MGNEVHTPDGGDNLDDLDAASEHKHDLDVARDDDYCPEFNDHDLDGGCHHNDDAAGSDHDRPIFINNLNIHIDGSTDQLPDHIRAAIIDHYNSRGDDDGTA